MEWLHYLENGLAEVVSFGKFCLEAISVFCVFIGLFKTIQLALKLNRIYADEFRFILVRIRFGTWLGLALEFQLGADILATTITPTTNAIIRLAAIALIRTFLNYFLNQELEKEAEMKKEAERENANQL
ncbi:MAG: DUF1622 domain-containing protein [Microcoleaceae cyanobacterium MO_207.B10]|nr:DUF1622 domain-containing protein [Microcoleaceae cyanobacterium MO_207.B10]